MQTYKIALAGVFLLALAACTPTVEKTSLAAPMTPSQLKFSITQEQGYDNIVYLQSQTPGIIPYWNWGTGFSSKLSDTIDLAFGGKHILYYGVSSAGNFVEADSVTVNVTQNDPIYFADPRWNMLTNGAAGKKWVLDMVQPIGWYGLDYLKNNGSAADWSWHPTYAGNEWTMDSVYYGSMTFNLDGNFNYSVSQNDNTGANPQNCNCTFSANLANNSISLNGCKLLYGGGSNYSTEVSNWSAVTILALSDSSMTLGVVRDETGAANICWIGFTFKPAP